MAEAFASYHPFSIRCVKRQGAGRAPEPEPEILPRRPKRSVLAVIVAALLVGTAILSAVLLADDNDRIKTADPGNAIRL